MSVTSISFGAFVLLVLAACRLTPARYRWLPLLIGSYAFYLTWQWVGLLFLAAQSLWAYAAGRMIERANVASVRRLTLALGLVPLLGMLLVMKYAGFAASTATDLLRQAGMNVEPPRLNLLLPLGVSFFTFAHAGYLIDVFKNRVPSERHLGRFALFGAFFPQMISGPIPRAGQLLPQWYAPSRPTEERLQSGAVQVLWGLFKKLVVADRLASYVNHVFADVRSANGATLLLAAYFFTFQIYCDFSGYTDIAIGAARVLGIDLGENFRRPYFARSIGEFWRRWHISLSTWFRDYLYIPLGGSRVALGRWSANVMIVFLVSGLWHGASWTFVIWGALHGLYLVVERLTGAVRDRLWAATRLQPCRPLFSIVVTFHLVALAWIVFRAATLSDAVFVVRSLPASLTSRASQGDSQLTVAISVLMIGLLLAVEAFQETSTGEGKWLDSLWRPEPVRWGAYIGLVLLILLLSVSSNGFIYGKF